MLSSPCLPNERSYYFPIPLPKFLGWSAIKRIVVGPRRAKTWGQSLSPVWWHLQAGRECAERTAIILDVADQPNYFLSPSSGERGSAYVPACT